MVGADFGASCHGFLVGYVGNFLRLSLKRFDTSSVLVLCFSISSSLFIYTGHFRLLARWGETLLSGPQFTQYGFFVSILLHSEVVCSLSQLTHLAVLLQKFDPWPNSWHLWHCVTPLLFFRLHFAVVYFINFLDSSKIRSRFECGEVYRVVILIFLLH